MKLSKKTKLNIIFLALIFIFTTFLGIGYAQISSIDLIVSGTASIKKQEGIMITDIIYSNGNNINPELSKINDFYQTTMDSTIILNNDLASTITYQVNIKNTFNENYTFDGAVYDSNFYDNPNIIYEITGINIGDKIKPNETKSLMITFKYNSTNISNNILNSFLNFKFKKENLVTMKIDENVKEECLPLILGEEATSSLSVTKGFCLKQEEPIIFNGTNDFIDTKINLFSEENNSIDFDIKFDVLSIDSNTETFLLSTEYDELNPTFGLQITLNQNELKEYSFPIHVEVTRREGIINLSVTSQENQILSKELLNQNNLTPTKYHTKNLIIGAKYNSTDTLDNYFKGSLSNIFIKIYE